LFLRFCETNGKPLFLRYSLCVRTLGRKSDSAQENRRCKLNRCANNVCCFDKRHNPIRTVYPGPDITRLHTALSCEDPVCDACQVNTHLISIPPRGIYTIYTLRIIQHYRFANLLWHLVGWILYVSVWGRKLSERREIGFSGGSSSIQLLQFCRL